MFKLMLCVSDTDNPTVKSDTLPEVGKAYVFLGVSGKPVYVAQVDNYDNKGTYRIVEGNPLAFQGANEALKTPVVINVERVMDEQEA